MIMDRTEINVRTGEKKLVVFTPEEEAEIRERAAQEAAERAARVPDPIQVFLDELRADPVKLARLKNVVEGR